MIIFPREAVKSKASSQTDLPSPNTVPKKGVVIMRNQYIIDRANIEETSIQWSPKTLSLLKWPATYAYLA